MNKDYEFEVKVLDKRDSKLYEKRKCINNTDLIELMEKYGISLGVNLDGKNRKQP